MLYIKLSRSQRGESHPFMHLKAQGIQEAWSQEPELWGASTQYVKQYCKGKWRSVTQERLKNQCHMSSGGSKRHWTVTLFSEPGRKSSSAVSRNSKMGLSCVTHRIRSSLCSSNRTDKVFPSSVLPGGERAGDEQEKLVNLKKMTVWFVKRDLTE